MKWEYRSMKWEYRVEPLQMMGIENQLNRWGQEGWELVAIAYDSVFLKRENVKKSPWPYVGKAPSEWTITEDD